MADVLVTAPAVPKKLFWVRIYQKDETGSVVRKLFSDDVIAVSQIAAQTLATAEAAQNPINKDADWSRTGVASAEVALA